MVASSGRAQKCLHSNHHVERQRACGLGDERMLAARRPCLTLVLPRCRLAKVAFLSETEERRAALAKKMEEAITKLPPDEQMTGGKGDEKSLMIAEKKQMFMNHTLVRPRLPGPAYRHPLSNVVLRLHSSSHRTPRIEVH